MKIGMISDTYLPQIGGAELHVYYLARNINQMGFPVRIFTNSNGNQKLDNISIYRNSNNLFGTVNNLNSFLKDVDLIHGHYTYYLSSLSSILAKINKIPMVVTLHGLGTLDSSVGHLPQRMFYRRTSLKFADAIIATSNEMFEVAEKFVNTEKIHMIPNGVDTKYFSPKKINDNDKIIVLSMRRLNRKNGVQYLIEAIPHIVKNFDGKIEFWIAGRKKLENHIKKRINELAINNYVKFIGEVPHDQTRNYYEKSDIVVFPSSAESTSLACLEAMSMEKAVVASSLVAYKDLIGNNKRGLLVNLFERDYSDYNAPLKLPDEKIKELSDAILLFANEKKTREQFGIRSRKYVKENYDWTIISKKVMEIYQSLCD